MPTSSQAMIVMSGEGENPRIPRRRYSTTAAPISVTHYDMDRAVKYNKGRGAYGLTCSRSRPNSAALQAQDCDIEINTKPNHSLSKKTLDVRTHSTPVLPKLQQQASSTCRQNVGLESLGFRRKRVGNSGQTTLVPIKSTNVQNKHAYNSNNISSPVKNRFNTIERPYVPKTDTKKKEQPVTLPFSEEPKLSLLEEIKQTVHYDNRIQPAMNIRRSLPVRNPLAVCLSFRENENLTHKEIKDILESHIGLKVRAIQFDPSAIRAADYMADTRNRWIITYSSPEECEYAVSKGLELNGDKIAVKLWDDVMLGEYEAYLLLQDDLKKEEARKKANSKRTKKVQRKQNILKKM